eukprot:SAG11_NODE_7814_length_1093_cov_0.756539_2_plen_79_part_00
MRGWLHLSGFLSAPLWIYPLLRDSLALAASRSADGGLSLRWLPLRAPAVASAAFLLGCVAVCGASGFFHVLPWKSERW